MTSSELLIDAFGRIRGVVHRVVDGLSADQLAHRLDGESNSIAWLVWHLTRIQDDHVAEVADREQVWSQCPVEEGSARPSAAQAPAGGVVARPKYAQYADLAPPCQRTPGSTDERTNLPRRGTWADRFALPFAHTDTGYGHTSADVGKVRVEPDLLLGYHDATHEATVAYLAGVTDDDLPRVVDRAWDPPVTLGVRLVSVVSDDLQHAGQAAFVRGLIG